MNLEFTKPQNLGSLLMKLIRSKLIATVIPLALKGILPIRIIPIGKIL